MTVVDGVQMTIEQPGGAGTGRGGRWARLEFMGDDETRRMV